MKDVEEQNEKKTINYIVKFYDRQECVYQSKCDFPVEKSRLNFNVCPLIRGVCNSGIQYNFDIDGLTCVNIKMSPIKDMKIPKIFTKPSHICDSCNIKHVEKER